jgi:hypothetical protein
MPETDVPAVGFVDNPLAPNLFATGATGFLDLHGAIMITLNSVHSDYSGPGDSSKQSLVVTGRLVMPVRGAQNLALGLFNFLKSIGLDPTEIVTPADSQPN